MKSALWLSLMLTAATLTSAQEKFHRDKDSRFIVEEGQSLPPFSFVTFAADTLDSDFFAQNVVLLQFVASWCPYSASQMKAIERDIWQKYQHLGHLQIYGFSVDEPADTAAFKLWLRDKNISYPFSYDADERIYKLFATAHGTVPRCILVDADGRIAMLSDEFYRRDYKRLRHLIRSMLRKMAK